MLNLRLTPLMLHFARYDASKEGAFQFAAFDISTMPSVAAALRRAMQEVAMLHDAVNEVEVSVVGPTTLLPLAEFQEEHVSDAYHLCFPEAEDVRVFYDAVPAAGVALLFGLSNHTCQALESLFPRVHYRSAHTPMLRRAAERAAEGDPRGHRVHMHIHELCLDVSVFENGRLVADNSFPIHTATDAVYYTLGLARQLHVSLGDAPFCLVGDGELRQEIHTLLQRFVARAYVIHASSQYNRHLISTTEGVPYDLVVTLLG